jgi:hypothetical protein
MAQIMIVVSITKAATAAWFWQNRPQASAVG